MWSVAPSTRASLFTAAWLARPAPPYLLHAQHLRCAPVLASGVTSWGKAAEKDGVAFVGSYARARDMPSLRLPEVALAGRSNVGKSSALNTLSGRRKKIAVVSKTPGRTRTLNLFRVGTTCAFTDLPGYGFAKVSQDMQDAWRKQIEAYLRGRQELRLAVLFVDAQREPQTADAQLLDFLEYEGMRTLVVATKTDKLNKQKLSDSLARLRESLALPPDEPLALSSATGEGKRELWMKITEMATDAPLRAPRET